jgi:transcriptional regulator GlxA family with amidase domain
MTDAPLAQIALDVGFANQAHFTRVLGRQEGLPPGRFRRLHRARGAGTLPRGGRDAV